MEFLYDVKMVDNFKKDFDSYVFISTNDKILLTTKNLLMIHVRRRLRCDVSWCEIR